MPQRMQGDFFDSSNWGGDWTKTGSGTTATAVSEGRISTGTVANAVTSMKMGPLRSNNYRATWELVVPSGMAANQFFTTLCLRGSSSLSGSGGLLLSSYEVRPYAFSATQVGCDVYNVDGAATETYLFSLNPGAGHSAAVGDVYKYEIEVSGSPTIMWTRTSLYGASTLTTGWVDRTGTTGTSWTGSYVLASVASPGTTNITVGHPQFVFEELLNPNVAAVQARFRS